MKLPVLLSVTCLVALGVGQGRSTRSHSYPAQMNPSTTVSSDTALKSLKLGPGIRVEPVGQYTLTAGGPTPSQINFGGEGVDFVSDGVNASFSMYDGELDMTFPVPAGANYAVITGGGWYSPGNLFAGFGDTQYPDRYVSDINRVWENGSLKTSSSNFTVSVATKIGSEKTINFAFSGNSDVRQHPYPIFLHTVQVHYYRVLK